jgi:hypothetical protein
LAVKENGLVPNLLNGWSFLNSDGGLIMRAKISEKKVDLIQCLSYSFSALRRCGSFGMVIGK